MLGLLSPAALDAQEQARPASSSVVIEDGGTGPHPAVVTKDSTLPGMTIYRPRDLSPFGTADGLFLGENSVLKRDPAWTIEVKNFD